MTCSEIEETVRPGALAYAERYGLEYVGCDIQRIDGGWTDGEWVDPDLVIQLTWRWPTGEVFTRMTTFYPLLIEPEYLVEIMEELDPPPPPDPPASQ